MNLSSKHNTYQCSNGERPTKHKIDVNVSHAKAEKIRVFKNDHARCYCEDCGSNQGRIDCSHTISINEAQNSGRTELAWRIENIKLRCRVCHILLDNKTSEEREAIYNNG